MWLFAGLLLWPPCVVLGSPEVEMLPLAPPGLSSAEGLPPSAHWQSFCWCNSRGCWAPVPKDTLLDHINFVFTRSPSFFSLQNCFPSDQTPEYSRSWIYVFLGGGLHTYSLWWTLCGPWPPFLQFFKTLWMAAQHSVVSATPPSFIPSTKQVPDPNKHEMDWTRRSLDGQISAQKCLSSTGPGCPAKSPSFLEIFRSYVDEALMGFVQWWPWKF